MKKKKCNSDALIDALKFIVLESSAIHLNGRDDLFERTQKMHERAKEALLEYGVPFDYATRTKEPKEKRR